MDKVNKRATTAPVADGVRKYNIRNEYGKSGLKKYAGVLYEEFIPELRGKSGIEVFREMADNDDIIGAILFAIKMLVRQTDWDVEAKGNTKADKEASEFIKGCLHDMEQSWQDTLSEILSFLTYGWSWHEILYKRRMGKQKNSTLNSKFDDGLIGWKGFPIRSQDTLYRWEYDEKTDELLAMSQMAPPDYAVRTIPKGKSIHFVTESRKGSPEGRSILRNAYRSYYFKHRMQEIEGIGVERDLAGLPMLTPPEGVDIWDAEDPDMVRSLAYAEQLVQNVRRDTLEGIVVPFGWQFQLLNGGSRRQFEIGTIIERYDSRMAMTVLADFVMLGHSNVGSFALSSDKTELFSVALGTYMNIICEAFNAQAIPKLIDLNAEHFKGITDYPQLIHGDVEKQNITEVATYIEKMTGIGVLVPDENLEKYVRRVGGLPETVERTEPLEYPEEEEPAKNAQKAPKTGAAHKPKVNANTETNEDTEGIEAARMAKAALGRDIT